jgi:hypothetical protein
MADYKEDFEISIDGVDEPIEGTVYASYVTEREECEPYSDGRSRGYQDVVVRAEVDRVVIGPLSYNRAGAIDFLGLAAVEGFESDAYEAAGA